MKTHVKPYLSALCAVLLTALLLLSGCAEKKTVTINGVDDLKGKKIGVQLGTTGDTYATDEVKGATVERYKKGGDAILALKQGKIDCVVIDNEPAKAFVKENSDLKILDEKCTEEEYAIALKKDSAMTAQVNGALAALKANGTLQKIIDNYIGDKAGETPYTSPADVTRDGGTFKIGTESGFAPYEYQSGGKIVGLDIDMAQAICDQLGLTLVVEDMDFDGILAAVQTGKVDAGVAGITADDERRLEVDFSDSYITASQVIIVRK